MKCIIQRDGALAQLGERVLCKHEVVGSNPISSTIFNIKPPELIEIYLYNGTFGIRLDARDVLKR